MIHTIWIEHHERCDWDPKTNLESFVESNMNTYGCPQFVVPECTPPPEPAQIGNGVVIGARQIIECGAVIPDGATVP